MAHDRVSVTVRRRTLLACGSAACLVAGLVSCAGFRGGWESVAYLGEQPPVAPSPSAPFELPGLSLRVTLHNRARTSDTQVMLFVVPVSIDPRRGSAQGVAPGRTRVYVNATPTIEGWLFRPLGATLSFDGKSFVSDAGWIFGQWDAQGRRVERGGSYDHQRVDDSLRLGQPGQVHLLSLDFPTSAPDPQRRDIVLDLGPTLRAESLPAVPTIRFQPTRWEEGYT
jgi:hypothetical protein